MKAADQFRTRTTRVNEMRQTDFTYFKIIERGWLDFGPFPRKGRRLRYLSTVLDDFSRYIIAWGPKAGVAQPVHQHAGRRHDRHAGHGTGGIGLRQRNVAAQA